MKYYLFILSVLVANFVFAQNNTQDIRGVVTDKLSQMPIIGATIQIMGIEKGTTTDTLGKYTLSNILPDRYDLKIAYLGYKSITIPNVVVTSGKEVILDIAMEEDFFILNEVVVKANNKGGTINKWRCCMNQRPGRSLAF